MTLSAFCATTLALCLSGWLGVGCSSWPVWPWRQRHYHILKH